MSRSRLSASVPVLPNHFDFVKKIGQGAFSEVYLIRMKNCLSKQYALKCLNRTTHPRRAEREFRILRDLGGKNNIMQLFFTLHKDDRIFFVLEYFPHTPFQEFFNNATIDEIRDYIKNLLIALQYLHEHGIIHYDVKPSNFLYDRTRKRYALIDFGLAEEMAPPVFAKPTSPPPDFMTPKSEETKEFVKPATPKPEVDVKGKVKLNFDKDSGIPSNNCPTRSQPPRILRRSPRKLSQRSFLAAPSQRLVQSRSQWQSQPAKPNQQSESSNSVNECDCFGRSQCCKICNERPASKVVQAGTNGFRAPETLLLAAARYQTTAIDVWASGIILLSFLSKRFPFMKPRYSAEALACIVALLGTQNVANVAKAIGMKLHYGQQCPRLDLRELCALFRLGKNVNAVGINQRKEACQSCLGNFQQTPTFNGKLFCLCHTGRDDVRGPLFKHCLKTEFPFTPSSMAVDSEAKATPAVLFDQAFDLLYILLEPNPIHRMTASDALNHAWFNS